MSIVPGTARYHSLIRFYRFDGLHVPTIIDTPLIVLQGALPLFLAGLLVFLISLNVPFASIISPASCFTQRFRRSTHRFGSTGEALVSQSGEEKYTRTKTVGVITAE